MHQSRWLLLALLLGCGEAPVPKMDAPPPTKAKTEEVTLTTVKWPALEAAIAAHKGKVVMVDVWMDSCVPCKKKFPSMLALQKKHADRGVVLISVTLDDADDAAKALTFLKKSNALIENYLLDEKAELVDEKFGGTALPIVNVFGRDGKRAKAFTEHPFEIEDIEKVVAELL